jgi:hypothetical protein
MVVGGLGKDVLTKDPIEFLFFYCCKEFLHKFALKFKKNILFSYSLSFTKQKIHQIFHKKLFFGRISLLHFNTFSKFGASLKNQTNFHNDKSVHTIVGKPCHDKANAKVVSLSLSLMKSFVTVYGISTIIQ